MEIKIEPVNPTTQSTDNEDRSGVFGELDELMLLKEILISKIARSKQQLEKCEELIKSIFDHPIYQSYPQLQREYKILKEKYDNIKIENFTLKQSEAMYKDKMENVLSENKILRNNINNLQKFIESYGKNKKNYDGKSIMLKTEPQSADFENDIIYDTRGAPHQSLILKQESTTPLNIHVEKKYNELIEKHIPFYRGSSNKISKIKSEPQIEIHKEIEKADVEIKKEDDKENIKKEIIPRKIRKLYNSNDLSHLDNLTF